ncbi:hypothetical protein BBP40_005230 [Aspergillus hancockii]|nr:hypothetical protein BBP40_005230 [Aspergillus hancockii]
MKVAYDAGVNFFDTAEVYSGGQSEIASEAIKKFGWKQNDLVVSTKGKANSVNPDKTLNNTRLDLPCVDVVYVHRPDRDTPIEEIDTLEWSATEISDAQRIANRLELVSAGVEQLQYNLLVREGVEKEYRRPHDGHGLGLTVFSPLKGGALTGKYNDEAAPPAGSRRAESSTGYVKNLQ